MAEKSVPFDITAERSVLGSILLEREAILVVSDQLRPEDFYLEKHAWVYEAMLACLGKRVPPDLTTIASELRRQWSQLPPARSISTRSGTATRPASERTTFDALARAPEEGSPRFR